MGTYSLSQKCYKSLLVGIKEVTKQKLKKEITHSIHTMHFPLFYSFVTNRGVGLDQRERGRKMTSESDFYWGPNGKLDKAVLRLQMRGTNERIPFPISWCLWEDYLARFQMLGRGYG